MITIVIADDEKLIRAGIKKILESDLQIPVNIIEARNGEEALDFCTKEKPELVITDIRMPRLDGVELMGKLSLLELKPAIIVLSGYDDFAYAKEAIHCGALAYILKPVDRKELVQAVSTAIAKVSTEEKKRNEQIIRTIIEEGRIDQVTIPQNIQFPNGFCVVSATGKRCSVELEKSLQSVSFYFMEQKKDYASLVIPREATYLLETTSELSALAIGISTASDSLTALRQLKIQSFAAMLQSYFAHSNTSEENLEYTRIGGVWHYFEANGVTNFSLVDAVYEKFVNRLNISNPDEVIKSLNSLFDFSKIPQDQKASCLFYIYNRITGNLFHRFPGFSDTDMYLHLKSIMIENIWLNPSLKEWILCVRDYAVYLATLLKQNTVEYPYITEALEYISKHFTTNLNMAMVANQVSVNYTWFSEKFKEHTGVNFNDYLKRLRLDEAKRLLEQDRYKVYEVATRSGFGDVKYFNKTFREEIGMTPCEYRRSLQKSTSDFVHDTP